MRSKYLLFVSLFAFLPLDTVLAQDRPNSPTPDPRLHANKAKPAGGGTATKKAAQQPPQVMENINVTSNAAATNGVTGAGVGAGLIRRETAPRSVSTVSANYIQKQTPGTSALQLIKMLPGANVGGSDPIGLSDQSTLSIRGLGQDEIGYVMEGIPLNDSGIYIQDASEWADSENMSSISVAQGAPGLTDPVYTSAGGVMTVGIRNPSNKFGIFTDAAYGTYTTNREFIRLDTGELGHTGVKAFVSFSAASSQNSHGPGWNHRRHVDFKLQKEWGDNSISLFGSYNSRDVAYYMEPTMSEWNALHYSANYAGSYTPGKTNYWKNYIGGWNDFMISAPIRLALTDHLHFTSTPYFYWGSGYYPGGTMVNETGNYIGTQYHPESLNLPGAINNQVNALGQYLEQEYTYGINSALHYDIGRHKITLGYWYDYQSNAVQMPFAALNSRGEARNAMGGYSITYPDGQLLLAGNNFTGTQINGIYVGDKVSLDHDRLQISAGFREMMISRKGDNYLPGPQSHVGENTSQPLPQFSLSYRPSPYHQIFVSASGNFRPPSTSNLFNNYSITTGAITSIPNTKLKDEYSIQEEIGYRYQKDIVASVTFFNYNFTNRQISTIIPENGALVSSYINAGGQTSRGFDAEIGTKPYHHFSPYASVEYLHATTDSNIAVGGDYLHTAGKTAIRSPQWQAAVGMSYDDGMFFANGNMKYVGSQYSTFMDDEKMPSYITGDLALGVRLKKVWVAKAPEFRLNFINIGNTKYLSGIAGAALNAKSYTGMRGTQISGSSASYFVGAGFAMMGSFQTAF
ncbi:TonB-dependent receptor [Gluconacetobacter entanii]|uniref:TonB-dependent receptor n=1 Tax=Gluconacetobacter entanii TaxID=108528 RepID=A0ABT3K625_9PROT|nr:TonB-dependent receptor [Gluconacetobacter entanii]MBE7620964.1 TonB-dependent receptor [Komagataeibacter sp. FXV2]MCW4590879.1 TonB-dependent receptor [Gluconacetobacter entanii]MCW4593051.1 TonB-dependent receptor [Gluconacetobacter entanii]NPC90205.1 TonB-dependent receptor [Gluconacetobacter entanii]